MTDEELRKKVELDFEWLVEIFPQIPEVTFLEPIVQAMAIFNAANNIQLTNDDLLIIAVSGFVATRARVIDEKRFFDLDPHTYLQFSFFLTHSIILKNEISDKDFKDFIERIHINKE